MLRGLLLFGALFASACARPSPPRAPARAPDVIVITVDTLRADRVGAYGYASARTATIDALARRGVRFANAITPQPRTTPALASMWTGLSPHRHGAREVLFPRRAGTTLAEVLAARGYATRAVSANRAASAETNLDTGFERFELRTGEDASVVTAVARELLDAPPEAPLLLWAHYLDPHAPYRAPDAAAAPETPACAAIQAEGRRAEMQTNRGGHSEAALPDCSRAYDAEIAWVDSQIATLLDALRAAGRLKRAFVVFTSDHGEGLGERGLWYEHGPNVHASNLDVPLSIGGPGIAGGGVVEVPVSLIDLAPTLLELLEVPPSERPTDVDGESVVPWLRGERAEPRRVVAEAADALIPEFAETLIAGHPTTGYCAHGATFALCWRSPREPATLHERASDPDHRADVSAAHPEVYDALTLVRARWAPRGTREHAVSDGRYKLVHRPRLEGGYARALYDRASDPGETRDVAEAEPAIADRLEAALEAWERQLPGRDPIALSPQQEEALRALGYIR